MKIIKKILTKLQIKLKQFKEYRWYRNKSFWITLFLAIFLWFYVSLNENYITMIEVPLNIVPPKGRAIEQKLNNNVSIEIEGNGWNLFNYIYLNNSKRCRIYLDNVSKIDSLFTINSVDFQKGLGGINKITPRKFVPGQLVVTTGEIVHKEVEVNSDIVLNLKEGFVLVGDIRSEPNKVTLSGNNKSLEGITSWKTSATEFEEVNGTFSYLVDLSDSLSSIIRVRPRQVRLYGEVQQYGEVTFDDIELKVVGGQLSGNHIISPVNFSVTLTGGIEQLSKVNANDIELSLDYDKIINDTIGILVPTIKIPPFTRVMNISPAFINHRIQLLRYIPHTNRNSF